ncbi:hypothetical protein [Brevundimonas sp.]|uniref:hypothetical protein n=1 Tax=Brevundimonas sp. TaxID=1871086 RepID=UPI0025EA128C|nr:hypothetical protein [Brevundimonas sp.]
MANETVLSIRERKVAAWAIAIGMLLCALGMTGRGVLAQPSFPDRPEVVASAPEAQPISDLG